MKLKSCSEVAFATMLAAMLAVQPSAVLAQDAAPKQASPETKRGTGAGGTPATPTPAQRKLPADSVTSHELVLPGRTLKFQATAGAIPLSNADGQLQTEIAYISYALLDAGGAVRRERPVVFAFNGGPGSASAWLHLGTIGPWRLPLEGAAISPSATPTLLPNAETWLDFADLVLVDPAGTGYSRVVRPTADAGGSTATGAPATGGGPPGGQRSGPAAWSVSGDIQSLADFIQNWIAKSGRHISPVVIAGESYGGFRTPRIAHMLQTNHGIGVASMIIISPVLDYGMLRGNRHLPLTMVGLLPSLAAAALEADGKAVTPDVMREVEAYAKGEFLADLMRGPRDAAAMERIVKRVAALTRLPEPVVRQYGGRLDGFIYRREAGRAAGQVASPYDASVKGHDPDPTAYFTRADDPFATALRAPLTSAMRELYTSKLRWTVDAKYAISNNDVSSGWQYGNSSSAPESVSHLRSALALDPRTTALVTHGYTDTVTPYFVSTLVIDQIPDYGKAGRLRQATYPGGHMYYSRDASRQRFREDVQKAIADALRRN